VYEFRRSSGNSAELLHGRLRVTAGQKYLKVGNSQRWQDRRRAGLALARLEAGVGLIDDVYPAFAPNDAAILVAPFGCTQRVENFHGSGFLRAISIARGR